MSGTDFRVAINETAVEIGKPEERHYISDFPGFGPVLDGLDFVLGHERPSGDSIYPKYLHELLESLTRRDASDARLNDMLVEQSQQVLSICDM